MNTPIRKHPFRGFTLIELLIVILIIAILSVIVIPRLMAAGRRAKEAQLVANLNRMRYSIERFQADTGLYPAVLTDIVAPNVESLQTPGIPQNTFKGAYISTEGGMPDSGLPYNPFVDSSDTDYHHHWKYDSTHGTVKVPDSLANIPLADGRTFSML